MLIGNLKIKNNLVLAPMAGVTDVAFRAMCARFGAGITYTEMVSAKGLFYNSKNTLQLLKTDSAEKIKAVQLFGSDPDIFTKVLKSGVLDKFDIIDINMGCPAPKIVKNKEGSFLMTDINLSRKIIEAAVAATDKPVTVKFRKGFDKDVAVQFALMCEKAGAKAITIHGRLREEFFSGNVDLAVIAAVVKAVKIPVIGNGDVCDSESLKKMLDTGVAAVMIGRAAMGCPYIFKELKTGKKFKADRYKLGKAYFNLLKKHDSLNLAESRKQFSWMLKSAVNAAELKNNMFETNSYEDCLKILKQAK